jgi:protocatechuate 3,4-dioxygenase beta subunit
MAAAAGVLARREAAAGPPEPPRAEAPKKPTDPDRAARVVIVRGRVLGPGGEAVAGAHLFSPHLRKEQPQTEEDTVLTRRGTTDGEGRFELELPRADVRPDLGTTLIASAPGFGVDWAELPKGGPPAELTLRLVKDQPIDGQVRSTEGKPLAGVQVRVSALFTTSEGRLDPFLSAWERDWNVAQQRATRRVYLPPGEVLSVKPTGADGRFRIAGVGSERVALLSLSGPGIARATLHVVGRAGFDPGPSNRAAQESVPAPLRRLGQPHLLYGPSFTHVAAPERLVQGTVREAGSGTPLAGITVWCNAGSGDTVQAVTDKQGRYRLGGLPKMREYLVHAEPTEKGAWLRAGARLQDVQGLDPIVADFEMARGVVVTGRVIDRTTGKGVQGGVRFVPLADNKYFGKKPGYDSYRTERLMTPTDAEGRFRLTVIPGSGVLMAQAYGTELKLGGLPVKPWRQAVLDPLDARRVNLVDPRGDRYFSTAGGGIDFLGTENACKVLDLAEDAGTAKCDLFLDRGRTLTVKVQDADGRPLAGALVAGMTASWPITFPLRDASCTVYALDPTEPRTVVIFHVERKLAGTLTVRGDEKEPLSVRLVPTGTLAGRLLDADGQPVAGVHVDLTAADGTVRELYRQLRERGESVRTDRDGRFRLTGLVPGVKFGLSLRQGSTFLVGEPRIGMKEVKPGQSLDLGEVRTRPQ